VPATKKSLFWVNDFPPVTSGIATFFVNILCRLPPDRIAVITPRMEGAARIDAGLNFPVERLSLPIGESRTDKLVKTVMTLFHAMKKSLLTRPARHHCGQVLSSGLAGWVCRLFLGTPYVV
jgi:phosphatidylinositol alpha-1,6-mannosyltransferase